MQDTKELVGRLSSTPTMEGWHEGEPTAHWRVGFPLPALENSLVLIMETKPWAGLGTHTDSAEEILFVLEGAIEARVGDERVELAQGEMAIVPELVPHGFDTAGERPARVLGFFPTNSVHSVFERPIMPLGATEVSIPLPPEALAELGLG